VTSYLVALTWVTTVPDGQSLVDNANMVLGLDIYVGDELTPHVSIEVGHSTKSRWTLCTPPRSGSVVGVLQVATELSYKSGTRLSPICTRVLDRCFMQCLCDSLVSLTFM
jgi:hypothetical protein